LNVRGEPIVNTLEQAHSMIIKTDMDYIVLGNYIVKK
jgi:predicted NodU family carbamoyl transferase